ncbi:MAG TPA: hypothetical protein VMZ53_18835 [Kofleriaceae bacterium]|nr:hypothetical protein [Kofleriaceae bacterium]
MRAAALVLLLLAACAGQTYSVSRITGTAKLRSDGAQGGEVSASFEGHGVGLSLSAQAQQLRRSFPDGTQSRIGGGVDLGMRVSLFGLIGSSHEIDHWFDIGGSAAGGGGFVVPARLTTYGEAWVGGWAAFGVYPGRRHLSIVLEVRRVAVTDWDNMTVFGIGLSLTERFFEHFSIRD